MKLSIDFRPVGEGLFFRVRFVGDRFVGDNMLGLRVKYIESM
jgi:hypothetical protein